VIGDQHQIAGADLGVERAGGIGEQERGSRGSAMVSSAGRMAAALPCLVVLAAGQNGEAPAAHLADEQVAAVAETPPPGSP
jgi:hypothetical protein